MVVCVVVAQVVETDVEAAKGEAIASRQCVPVIVSMRLRLQQSPPRTVKRIEGAQGAQVPWCSSVRDTVEHCLSGYTDLYCTRGIRVPSFHGIARADDAPLEPVRGAVHYGVRRLPLRFRSKATLAGS